MTTLAWKLIITGIIIVGGIAVEIVTHGQTGFGWASWLVIATWLAWE